jgi:hypothetical protein
MPSPRRGRARTLNVPSLNTIADPRLLTIKIVHGRLLTVNRRPVIFLNGAMLLIGFAGIGFAGYRRSRRVMAPTRP